MVTVTLFYAVDTTVLTDAVDVVVDTASKLSKVIGTESTLGKLVGNVVDGASKKLSSLPIEVTREKLFVQLASATRSAGVNQETLQAIPVSPNSVDPNYLNLPLTTDAVEVVQKEKMPNMGSIVDKLFDAIPPNAQHARRCVVPLPADFGPVGAVIVTLQKRRVLKPHVFLAAAEIVIEGRSTIVPCQTYLSGEHGPRVFFAAPATLPQQTPQPLLALRQRELEILRGERRDLLSPYQPKLITEKPEEYDRFYQYDVYNDLGKADPTKPDTVSKARPTLGASLHLPYPRRCRTGRVLQPDGTEPPPKGENWVPQDEDFSKLRSRRFRFQQIVEAIPLLRVKLAGLLGDKQWDSFAEIIDKSYYNKDVDDLLDVVGKLDQMPKVVEQRGDTWQRDEEFGRQVLAGTNPSVVQVLRQELLSKTKFESTVPPQLLDGTSISQWMATAEGSAYRDARLFVIDYYDVFIEFGRILNEDKSSPGFMYGARCLLFLCGGRQLVPVAVELTDPTSGAVQVVTAQDPPGLWLLAKAHFLGNDSGYHQLVSHFLCTHACVEPAIMATHRQLSAAHPLHKLLLPHTRYTMKINANARSGLINADGIIESSFTPGPLSMQMGSKVYGAWWQFNKQGLKEDLLARGMAYRDASGALQLTIPDYPYAADGLLIYEALEQWVMGYLSLYYTSDADVLADKEVMAWWQDFVKEGHPDKQSGWPQLTGLMALRDILVTVMWVASAQHAAVNFGQYDFSGFMPNRPSMTREPLPLPGTPDYQSLLSGDPAQIERVFLKVTASPDASTTVAFVVQLLSTHFDDEQYLCDEVHSRITDSSALDLYRRLVQQLKDTENIIEQRNADPSNLHRCGGVEGNVALPYTLLKPSSEEGVTMRGIPTSISI